MKISNYVITVVGLPPFPQDNPCPLQIRGEYVDEFICEAQDRTRNAHAKSVAAAFNVWRELLQADQVTFESERISWHVCKKVLISQGRPNCQ